MPLIRADSSGVRRALKAFAASLDTETEQAVAVAAQVAEGAAKQTTAWKDGEETWPDGSPRRHGIHTRDTIEGRAQGHKGWVEAGGAARFLENGTRPHLVAARGRGHLRFFVNGEGPIFARLVHVRGIKPTYFLRSAALEAAMFLRWKLRAVVNDVKRRVGLP